jgi:hexosaminidase
MNKKYAFFLCSLLFLFNGFNAKSNVADDFSKHFKLIPQPQKVVMLKGEGLSYADLRYMNLQGTTRKPALSAPLSALSYTNSAGPGVLTLIRSNDASLPASPEGYTLVVNNKQVTIKAREDAGLFYGIQTLLQLLDDAHDQQISIPACTITDFPEISYRAIHLDLKHHLDATRYYYDMIDRLAKVKINAIVVEFEDKLRYRKAPVVGATNAISIEEFAAISRYAAERYIEVTPLVQGLGHASFILKHPEYQSLRDNPASDWSFNPLDSATYKLQFALYEDAMAATPYSKYLHIGGDEVGSLGHSEQAKKSGMKPFELQMHWLNRVSEFAKQHNRIPIFWDDMVFKLSDLYETTYDEKIPLAKVEQTWKENEHRLSENLHLFPKNCIFMRWNYSTSTIPGNLKAIDWYNNNQLKSMAATAAQTTWSMMPRDKSNFAPIKDFCRVAAEKKMSGILCTVWDDCSPHFETVWRGLYDFALFSWNYENISVEDAHAMYRHRFYAPAASDASFEFQDGLEEAMGFWGTAFVNNRRRENYPEKIELISLPDADKPGTWSESNKDRIAKAKLEVARYDSVKLKLTKTAMLAHRNQFAVSLLNQMNELQIYNAKMLVLLENYDKATTSQARQKMRQHILDYVSSFDARRKSFEAVFSQTRMLNNPEGYVLDQNHHAHLANGDNSSDWMYVYELAMNEKINNWLTVINKMGGL